MPNRFPSPIGEGAQRADEVGGLERSELHQTLKQNLRKISRR